MQHDPFRVTDTQIKATDDYQHLWGLRGQVQPAYSEPETLLACRLALRYMREHRVCITRQRLEQFLPQARQQLGTLTSVQSLQGNLRWSGQVPGLQGTEFGKWLLAGGKQPDPQSGNMNCWEVILFGAFRGGFLSKTRLRTFYQNFAADVNQQLQQRGNPTQYFETQLRSSNEYTFDPRNPNTPKPLPGDIVIFQQAAAHAAIAIGGNLTANGEHEILSLWNTPNNHLFLQRTTIEALLRENAPSPVKFWSPNW